MRLTTAYLRRLSPLLDYYGHFHPSVLSIQQFMDFGELALVLRRAQLFTSDNLHRMPPLSEILRQTASQITILVGNMGNEPML